MSLEDVISNYVAYDQEVLSMEPELKPQPRLLGLDDKILLNIARANVLSQITVSITSHKKIQPDKPFFCHVPCPHYHLFQLSRASRC